MRDIRDSGTRAFAQWAPKHGTVWHVIRGEAVCHCGGGWRGKGTLTRPNPEGVRGLVVRCLRLDAFRTVF